MTWMNMICGHCGHQDDIDSFCSTPIAGALPKNTYQCPNCRMAFVKKLGPPTLMPSGFVMPGAVELVVVQSHL